MSYLDKGTFEATAIVSLDPDRSGNFICSGTSDNVEIQAALDYVNVMGGGEVYVCDGTYNLTAPISILGNDITFSGSGRDTIIFITTGSFIDAIIASDRNGIIISRMEINGNYPANAYQGVPNDQRGIAFDTCEDCIVVDCRVDNTPSYGIQALDSSLKIKIVDCIVENANLDGVEIDGSTFCLVIGCLVDTVGITGIEFEGSSYCIVSSCTIKDAASIGIGIRSSAEYNIVSNCVVEDITLDAIKIESDYNDVSDCTINTSGRFHVSITTNCQYYTISGCIMDTSVNSGIYTLGFNGTISDNIIQGAGAHGIHIDEDDNSVRGNTVIAAALSGIYVDEADSILVIGNYVYGSVANDGIQANESTLTSIIGNISIGNDDAGILLRTSTYCFVNGNYALSNGRSGIELFTSDYNAIISNYVDADGAAYGINLNDADCDQNTIKNNILIGWGSYPLRDAGTESIFDAKVFQLTEPLGTAAWQTASPTGILVNAADEGGLALASADLEVQQIVRVRVKGVAIGATGAGKGMLLEIKLYAGKPTGSELYNAEAVVVASVISTEDNVGVNDAIEWTIDNTDDGDLDDIRFGETIEMFALYEDDGVNGDIATNAVLRTISLEYV